MSGKKAGKRRKRDEMDVDEVREVLCELGTDMQALWEDGSVRALLKRRKVRMDERSGLYVSFPFPSSFFYVLSFPHVLSSNSPPCAAS